MVIDRMLTAVFRAAGLLAGAFLVIIAVLVIAQIVGRLIGVQVVGADEFARYALAASSFLGLSYAFRMGNHIRVTLLIDRFPAGLRRAFLILALLIGLGIVGYLAFNTVLMVIDTWKFKEMSPGQIRYPLWIPQLSMAVGMVLFALALLEDLVRVMLGVAPNFEANQQSMGLD
jgi:TRAP-type C4-dicarboxylate transport system permease small subunit